MPRTNCRNAIASLQLGTHFIIILYFISGLPRPLHVVTNARGFDEKFQNKTPQCANLMESPKKENRLRRAILEDHDYYLHTAYATHDCLLTLQCCSVL